MMEIQQYLEKNKIQLEVYLKKNLEPTKIGKNMFYHSLICNETILICLEEEIYNETIISLINNYKEQEVFFLG